MSQSNAFRPDCLLVELRNTFNKISSNRKANEENQKQMEIDSAVVQKNKHESLITEVASLRAQLMRRNNDLEDTKRLLEKQQHQISNNYKRQFRHLSDTLVQKEAEIQYLNKQVLTLKNRVTSLELDLNQANANKKSLEQGLTKNIDLIRSQFKELFDSKQDQELNRFLSQTNLKQINDKLGALTNLCFDLEKKKSFMEEKYCILKKQNYQQIQNNIKFEVEIEKLKEQLWQEKQIVQSFNQHQSKQFAREQVDYFANKSKSSRYSFAPPSQKQSQEEKKDISKLPSGFQNLEQTINLLKAQTNMLLNFEEKFLTLNKKINHDADIWRQVITVKQLNSSLQIELNQLKTKINYQHEDLILKEKHPSLYQFFQQKMSQVQQFEKRLEELENQSHKITQTLDQMLYNGVPQKEVKPNESEILERQNFIRSKVKKQMLQAFEAQKQTLLKDSEQFYASQIQTLKNKISELMQEISRLQDKNENLFNLLQESQKINKQKSQTKDLIQKVEQKVTVVESISIKNETQSINGMDPSQISHLNFLEEKIQRLEEQLKQSNKKIDNYKKEIRKILQVYKLKNTKNKYLRCSECMLSIDNNEDYSTKCQKCKVDIHEGECFRMHDKTCKRNEKNVASNNNNKPKPKKPQPKLPVFSQRIDYF